MDLPFEEWGHIYLCCSSSSSHRSFKTFDFALIRFTDVALSDISTIGEKKWDRATERYQRILEPIYEKISLILKSKLHTHLDEPNHIIEIFLKYETIVQSADIMELLSAERQHFLQTLHKFVNELKESLTEPKMYPEDSEISAICWETIELKLFQNQVNHFIRG